MDKPTPHILHLTAGCWADGGGLSEAVASLAATQARLGYRVTVACLSGRKLHPILTPPHPDGLTVRTFPPLPPLRLHFSPELFSALPELMHRITHVHLHGGWSIPVFLGAAHALRAHLPLQWSPHGSLGEAVFCRHRLLRWPIWALFYRRLLRKATRIHACSEAEAKRIAVCLGASCPPVITVADGVTPQPIPDRETFSRQNVFLFLGRLHPLKGLDLLREAWLRSGLGEQGWELWIAGPEDGCAPPCGPAIRYLGTLDVNAKWQALRSAAALILPSRSENFGISVAEALCCRTPAICTEQVPWPELGEFRVPLHADALCDAMRRMAGLSPEMREARFAPLFDSAKARFDWERIAAALAPPLGF